MELHPYSPFTPSWRDRDNFQESSGNTVHKYLSPFLNSSKSHELRALTLVTLTEWVTCALMHQVLWECSVTGTVANSLLCLTHSCKEQALSSCRQRRCWTVGTHVTLHKHRPSWQTDIGSPGHEIPRQFCYPSPIIAFLPMLVFWATRIRSTPSDAIQLKFLLILTSYLHLGLSCSFFLSDFPTKTLYVYHISLMRTECLSWIFHTSN